MIAGGCVFSSINRNSVRLDLLLYGSRTLYQQTHSYCLVVCFSLIHSHCELQFGPNTHTPSLYIYLLFLFCYSLYLTLFNYTHTHRHTVIDGPVMISACIVDEGHAAMVTGAVSDSPCPPVCVCRLSVFADLTLWVVASSLFIYFCILMCVFCVFVCLCNYLCLCVDVCICACMCVCLFAFCMFMCFFSCLREPM